MFNNPNNPLNPLHTLHNEHPKLTSYKAFYSYLLLLGSETTTDVELQYHYDNSLVHINLNGYTISVPFDSVIYNALLPLVETIMKEF